MDDDLKLLEDELTRLTPVTPSPELREAIAKTLARRARSRLVTLGLAALPFAAAAAWMLVFAGDQPAEHTPALAESGPAFKPVAAQNLLVASQDEGYVTLANGSTARRVRQSYLDTFTWKNPRTQASLRWTVPREEIRVVPISYQ
jgi:hypothetical protein